MLDLKDGFVLYHGSYCEVKEPDLAKCAKRKDFGQGFYFNHIKGAGRKFSENLNSQSYRNWNKDLPDQAAILTNKSCNTII